MEKDIKELLLQAKERPLTQVELAAWRNHFHHIYVEAHKWLQVARAHETAYRGYVAKTYTAQTSVPSTPVSKSPQNS